MKNVVLVGTGNIAAVHAEALRATPSARLVGVFDSDRARAERFAKQHNIERIFDSLNAVQADEAIDVVHVLTPPPVHHLVAMPLLKSGKAVFVEKPIAETSQQGREMASTAQANNVALRINQNFIFHPAHLKLKTTIAENRIGKLRRAVCHYVMPLRQMQARQFGHWMFDSPLNLLLEQAVHPLSQLEDAMGPLTLTAVVPGPVQSPAKGIEIITAWDLTFSTPNGPAQMHIALGGSYHDWSLTVLGDDGRIHADYLANRVEVTSSGAGLEALEHLRTGLGRGLSTMAQSLSGFAKYGSAQAGLLQRNDSFFASIKASIADFYQALELGGDELDGARGIRLVTLCEKIAAQTPSLATPPVPTLWQKGDKPADCVVLGGTGFIGRALVTKLIAEEKTVLVLARNTRNLAADFVHDNIRIVQGSASNETLLHDCFDNTPVVINLAHGGGGDSYNEILEAMRGSALTVAKAAAEAGVQRLLHVSSIAALYLGEADATITARTGVDPQRETRADYARAKAETELALLKYHTDEHLPVSLYRPGIVVGQGASPFHSGVGLYNRDRWCLGWNAGRNPLPFVLVDDVADALYRAAFVAPADKVNGQSFNLVGDVRMTARDYTSELAQAMGRPLEFRPQQLWLQQAGEVTKWLIKKLAGRKAPFPSSRDLLSRGMASAFDTSIEKSDLDWHPVAERQVFVDRAIRIHGNG